MVSVILDGEGVGEGEGGLVGRATARVTYEESATGVATSTSTRGAKASSRDFFSPVNVPRGRAGERRRIGSTLTLHGKPGIQDPNVMKGPTRSSLPRVPSKLDIFTIRAISDSDVV